MLQKIRFVLASALACAMFAGCIGAPEDAVETEEVGTAEEAVRKSDAQRPRVGVHRTYYSDSSRTTVVGYVINECDPDYDDTDGITTNYYKEYRWSCPDNPFPFTPYTLCYDCVTWTASDGTVHTSCTSWACA